MNSIEQFNQLKETTVTRLRNWAECGGLFPEKELNAFFYWFKNDKDKGHRRIAAQQLTIECITAFHGSDWQMSLNDLENRLNRLIDMQEVPPCTCKIAKNRLDAEKWLNLHAIPTTTLQEITEICTGKEKHIKIYVLDLNGRRVQCVTICPHCWSMAEEKDIIKN